MQEERLENRNACFHCHRFGVKNDCYLKKKMFSKCKCIWNVKVWNISEKWTTFKRASELSDLFFRIPTLLFSPGILRGGILLPFQSHGELITKWSDDALLSSGSVVNSVFHVHVLMLFICMVRWKFVAKKRSCIMKNYTTHSQLNFRYEATVYVFHNVTHYSIWPRPAAMYFAPRITPEGSAWGTKGHMR